MSAMRRAMIDVGSGPAIVLIPGIQGRWEWMRPAVRALAIHWRVIASSLPGEPGEARGSADGFDELARHVDRLLDEAHISSAVICGLSVGGLVALRYAATRPERVRALILVSTPGPRWAPTPGQAGHLRRPILTLPFFLAGAMRRAWRELRTTLPSARARLIFCMTWGAQILAAPGIPWRMASRGRLAAAESFENDCLRITVPTLVIVGERELDKVVCVDDTMEYVRSIAGAEFCLFERTGHLGTASAPDRFAAIVSTFLRRLPTEHA
jgi:pimeloyl-ACP methyl ester carboxylesterase